MQRLVWTQPAVRTCATVLVLVGALASRAQAQPGQPSVTINPDLSIVLSYVPQSPVPAGGAFVEATYNGAAILGSPFFIGQATTVTSPPLPVGNYAVRILWAGGAVSAPTGFSLGALGALGAPAIRGVAVDLDTVMLVWDPPSGGPISNYELEVTVVRTGQVVNGVLGSASSATFRNVPPGLYRVRVRALSSFDVGPYSDPSRDFAVGTVASGAGDLQVSLTWNSTVDMDLHLLEPDGRHVYYDRLFGQSARLDFDDTNGFGPENMLVSRGLAMPGVYRIFIVHNSQDLETTSTVAVTLGADTATPSTTLFTRRTRRAAQDTAVLVATVNVVTGEIVEMLGTGDADEALAPGLDVPAKTSPK